VRVQQLAAGFLVRDELRLSPVKAVELRRWHVGLL
jgi:hypothetical protein